MQETVARHRMCTTDLDAAHAKNYRINTISDLNNYITKMDIGFCRSYNHQQTIKKHQVITSKSCNTPIKIKTNNRIKWFGIHK
jgi:hypothetical protein